MASDTVFSFSTRSFGATAEALCEECGKHLDEHPFTARGGVSKFWCPERDTLPAPPPTEPENPKPAEPAYAELPSSFHRWCAPELGACGICDEYPMLRAAHAQRRDEAGRA